MMNVREWALPVYTILMQLAVGTLAAFWLIRAYSQAHYGKDETDQILRYPMLVIFFTILVAMIGSHFHLSKPYLSFLSIRNFDSSWLSREIVLTTIFFAAQGCLCWVQLTRPGWNWKAPAPGWLVVFLGFLVIYSMAKIYLLPTQVAWNTPVTVLSYFKSVLLLGVMATSSLLTLDLKFASVRRPGAYQIRVQVIRDTLRWLCLAAIAAAFLSVALEVDQILTLGRGNVSAQASLSLWMGIYRPLFVIHVGLLIAGVGWLVLTTRGVLRSEKSVYELVSPTYVACLMVIVAEILGRFLFYATHVRTGI